MEAIPLRSLPAWASELNCCTSPGGTRNSSRPLMASAGASEEPSELHIELSVVTPPGRGSANDVVDDGGSFDGNAAVVVDVVGEMGEARVVGAVVVRVLTVRSTTLLQVERVSSSPSLEDVKDRTLKYLKLGRPSEKAQVSAPPDTMNDEALAKFSDSEAHTSSHIGSH
mmetsp:Transcript_22738/g.59311  ORF Transcript_22738/g.59311 Transcript_22738/m.59311 type:complete len:169 (-) Transcript_22738:323-829(-)